MTTTEVHWLGRNPADFRLMQQEGWYRIPQGHAPKGLHAEYIAFYFGGKFGEEKWAIHYYARNMGHELLRRRDLFPDQAGHERSGELYYKIQLGELVKLREPIVSLRWRRLTFLHTTWDRFIEATEIGDLLVSGGDFVNRQFATLREGDQEGSDSYESRIRGASDLPPSP